MIFDNLENSEQRDVGRQEEYVDDYQMNKPVPHGGPATIAQNPQQQHFTLNKYDSRPSLKEHAKAQGVVEVDSEDPQVQTAHFNKHGNPSSHKSEMARTGTEQT